MRKLIAAAAVAGLVMMGGGNAFAGDVTGNGKPTPVANPGSGGRFVAGSICAFNGAFTSHLPNLRPGWPGRPVGRGRSPT